MHKESGSTALVRSWSIYSIYLSQMLLSKLNSGLKLTRFTFYLLLTLSNPLRSSNSLESSHNAIIFILCHMKFKCLHMQLGRYLIKCKHYFLSIQCTEEDAKLFIYFFYVGMLICLNWLDHESWLKSWNNWQLYKALWYYLCKHYLYVQTRFFEIYTFFNYISFTYFFQIKMWDAR